jgi:glycosyltransferase involved in cell wall biosynthesis
MPDTSPYSLCAKSIAQGFIGAGFFVEKSYSSELDNKKIIDFEPDFVLCFGFSELIEGLLDDIFKCNKNCIFIFDFLTSLKSSKYNSKIKRLKEFSAKKVIFTSDKSNMDLIEDIHYLPNSIDCNKYKTSFSEYKRGITLLSNPDNINVLKVITDLISHFGKISFFANEFDYLNSLDNELWAEINDSTIKDLYRKSYCGDIVEDKERLKILSTSFITIVPITQTLEGVDYRILEAAATKSFVIAEENNETKRLFDAGREIETYKYTTELNDKIEFYLKRPSIARSIGENARKAVVNNHNIKYRIKNMIEIINETLKNK